jgi:hypothetical protein
MDNEAFERLITMLTEALARVEQRALSVPADRWEDSIHSGDGYWTRRQILAHVAANDLRQLVRVRVGAGIELADDHEALAAEQRLPEWNQARVDERADHGVTALIEEMRANRTALITLLRGLTPEQRDRPMPFRGQPTPLAEMVPTLVGHLDAHAREIAC